MAFVAAVAVAAIMWSGEAVPVTHADEKIGKDVAAKIGDTTITLTQVDERAKQANAKVYQELFDARNRALNELIAEKLLTDEAAAQGITPDQLIQREIVDKVGTVSDEQIEAFFNQNKARMGGRSLEQMRTQIGNYLLSENRRQARVSYIDGLRSKQDITVALDPPRTEIAIASNDPRLGPDTAKVRIVEFSDFQ